MISNWFLLYKIIPLAGANNGRKIDIFQVKRKKYRLKHILISLSTEMFNA